jgi:iron complex transport system ATP-binding protein
MKDGTFYRDGSKEDILTDGTIGALFGVRLRIHEEGGWYYATGY